MPDALITRDGPVSVPLDYTVPNSGEIVPIAMRAVFDGSAAAGSFLPTLRIIAPNGSIVATCPADTQVAAGGSAACSWFPGVGQNITETIGPGVGCVYYVGPPTGIAAVDTAAIQAGHDALPATGGIVQLCRGKYKINTLTFTKPIELAGHGKAAPPDGSVAADEAATTLEYAHTTGSAIVCSNPGTFLLRDFDLVNTTTPVSDAGVLVQGSGSDYPRSFQLINVSIRGFYTNLHVQAGNGWLCQRCYFGDWVNEGVLIENTILADAGDMGFEGCYFAWGPNNQVAANHGITWHSSGGLRIVNSKFNWYSSGVTIPANSIAVQIAPTAGIATSDILFANCSIENFQYGVALTGGSAATVFGIVVVSCQFACPTACVAIVPSITGIFSAISIAANVFNGESTGIGLQLQNLDNIKYGPNVYVNCATNISLGAGITNATAVGGG